MAIFGKNNNCGEFLDILDSKMIRRGLDSWTSKCHGIKIQFKSGQIWEMSSPKKIILVEFVYPYIEKLEESRANPILIDVDTEDGVIDNYADTYIDLWVWDSKRTKLLSETKWSMLNLASVKLIDKNGNELLNSKINKWKWNKFKADDIVIHKKSSHHLFRVLEVMSSEPEKKGGYLYRSVLVSGADIQPPVGWETNQSIIKFLTLTDYTKHYYKYMESDLELAGENK